MRLANELLHLNNDIKDDLLYRNVLSRESKHIIIDSNKITHKNKEK